MGCSLEEAYEHFGDPYEDFESRPELIVQCSERIENFEGIQYCHNLKYLVLASEMFTDLSAVTDLEKLESVWLLDCPIEDISPLFVCNWYE